MRIPLAALAFSLLIQVPALCATIRVPADHATIAAAVAAAQPGDVILIASGTYTESVVVDGIDGITLKGKGGPVIDGTGTDSCLDLRNLSGARVSGVTLSGARFGLRIVDSSGVSVIGSTITGVTDAGVLIERSAEVDISRSTIRESAGAGILATGGAQSGSCRFTRLLLQEIDGSGIDTDGIDGEVSRSRFEDVGGTVVVAQGDRSTVSRNVATRGTRNGFQTFADDSPVERCRVDAAQEEAIQTFALNCHVVRCRVSGTGEDGVEVFGASSNVDRCVILSPALRGITIAGDDGLAVRNKVVSPGTDGFFVSGARCTVDRNLVTNAGGSGFVAFTGTHTISRNTARGSAVLDADDRVPGTNTWTKNRFGTSNIP